MRSPGYPHFYHLGYEFSGFYGPFWFSSSLEWLTKLREALYLQLPFYYKAGKRTSKMNTHMGPNPGEWEGVTQLLCLSSWNPGVFTNQEALPASLLCLLLLLFFFVIKVSSCGYRWFNHWPWLNSISSPSSIPRGQRRGLKFQPCNLVVGFSDLSLDAEIVSWPYPESSR